MVLCLLLWPRVTLAHSPFATEQSQWPLGIAAGLLLALGLTYNLGAGRVGPGFGRWLTFNAATLIAVFALFGPLDIWAETSAAMHMTQHMVMMVIIAPLWVMAQPLPQLVALNPPMGMRLCRPLLRLVGHPVAAACLHAIVIWFWHAPKLYVLALENPWWHVVEHACFLMTAGLFWWAVLRSGRHAAPYALLALLFTLMHTGFLGALLTFASAPLYGEERDLQSQQLAGLIMWVLGGLPYLAASAWIGARWFLQLLRRTASSLALPGDGHTDK